MNVLWADDQVNAAKTFSAALGGVSEHVSFFPDGESALQALQDHCFDLALIDLAMPPGQWGGLWLLKRLNDLQLDVPVIVVSGEGTQQETIAALRLGAKDYIVKENLDEELSARIQEVIKRLHYEVVQIIKSGECDTVEFKSTLRWNLHAKRADPQIELSVLKTIAAFMNSSGGSLFVGVSDEGVPLGLDQDQFPNEDKFQLHFWNRIRDAIGADFTSMINARIMIMEGKKIFRVHCRASERPVFVRWKGPGDSKAADLFYIRAGPQTEALDIRQALEYISQHFPKPDK